MMERMHRTFVMIMVVAIPLLSACATVGPDYMRPAVQTPAAFKEMEGWKATEPRDSESKGPWWEIYADPLLNELEAQVDVANQTVAQAEAQYRQARALVAIARAGYFPTVGASASASRSRSRSQTGAASSRITSVTEIGPDASWEPDLWGGVRRAVESSVASAQASAADVESMRLSLHAELAQDYFQLRALDAQRQVLDNAVAAFQQSLELTNNRYQAGVAARSDVIQAEAQLKTARAQAIDVGVQRAQFEHAIAVLTGKPPADFSLAPAPLSAAPPAIPVSMPSELLERRPDVASAERRVASANAQIGVAQAAFYPTLTLSASLGAGFTHAFSAPALLWSVGAALAQTIFDGGARQGRKEQSIAAYEGTVAAYRQSVLAAFQEVEDNLAALSILEEEVAQQAQAVADSREAVTLVLNQYKAGTVSHLEVLTAQQTALTNERAAVDLASRRFVASVVLVRALGGGWSADRLPAQATIEGLKPAH
jgi:NodT family efflux transporter outer membrane factor (OMF) lipoprotein